VLACTCSGFHYVGVAEVVKQLFDEPVFSASIDVIGTVIEVRTCTAAVPEAELQLKAEVATLAVATAASTIAAAALALLLYHHHVQLHHCQMPYCVSPAGWYAGSEVDRIDRLTTGDS
jgi:hypothetical protein